jgi:hypothetical protein
VTTTRDLIAVIGAVAMVLLLGLIALQLALRATTPSYQAPAPTTAPVSCTRAGACILVEPQYLVSRS